MIVGFYNSEKEDFEEHNRMIDISNGRFEIKDTTRPYGFVDMNAKVWFEWFEDDGIPHEYLMTEGYLWTGQYPECRRVIEKGNNQSMELDQTHLDAYWTKDDKDKPEFFIINEAIMSKLCILGEDVEPCFEGASISGIQFSFDDSFKADWANMMNQMKEILKNEGGAPVFKYTVNSASDTTPIKNYLANQEDKYSFVECYKEEDQDFAVLQKDGSFFRMNYSLNGDEFIAEAPVPTEYGLEWGYDVVRTIETVEAVSVRCDEDGQRTEERVVVTTEHSVDVSGPMEDEAVASDEDALASEVAEESQEFVLNEEPAVEAIESPVDENAEVVEFTQDVTPAESDSAPAEEDAAVFALQTELDGVKANYAEALGAIDHLEVAKAELSSQFAELQTKYEALENANNKLMEQLNSLNEFKLGVEREKKMALIEKFYMLNDTDKADVITNIDTYSLDDIEAKLCVVCFRNHINFNDVENETPAQVDTPIVYNLDNTNDGEDLSVPAWVKAVRATQKNLDN